MYHRILSRASFYLNKLAVFRICILTDIARIGTFQNSKLPGMIIIISLSTYLFPFGFWEKLEQQNMTAKATLFKMKVGARI